MTPLEIEVNGETAPAVLDKENIKNNENVNINGKNIKNEKINVKGKSGTFIINKKSKLIANNDSKFEIQILDKDNINRVIVNNEEKNVLNDKKTVEELEKVNEKKLLSDNKSSAELVNDNSDNKNDSESMLNNFGNENASNLLKEKEDQISGERKFRYSLRKRNNINNQNSSVYNNVKKNNKKDNNSMKNNILDNKDTPQNKEKTEEDTVAKYSMRKRKNINYKEKSQYYILISDGESDNNDTKKEIKVDKNTSDASKLKNTKPEKIIKSNIKKDTPSTPKLGKIDKRKNNFENTTVKKTTIRLRKTTPRPQEKAHYGLRSRDKKLIAEKKKILKQKEIQPPKEAKEKPVSVNKSREFKNRRLKELSNENTVNKIKDIFSTLPLFKGISDFDNIDNEEKEELNEVLSDNDNKSIISDNDFDDEERESISDNDFDDEEEESINENDFDEKENNESHRSIICVSNKKFDNMMEDSLYAYISRFPNSKLKNYMRVIKFMKDPSESLSFQTFKKRKYFYSSTDTLLSTQKDYLTCGLYSDEFRYGTKRRKLSSGPHDIETLKKNFKFPSVLYYGEYILNEQTDFKLPIDIYLMVKDPAFKRMLDSIPNVGIDFKEITQNIYLCKKPHINEDSKCDCKKGENCGESCLNRIIQIECDPRRCPCGDKCTNQRFSHYKKNNKNLKVFWTGNKGYGLKTESPIRKDELIIEYTGEIMSHQACIDRLNTSYKNMSSFYFIEFGDGKVIDACEKGSIARFANHSCDPNCHIERWTVNNEYRLGLFASRDIKAGEELFYDYNYHSYGEKQQKCYCGSKNCRGIIGQKNVSHSLFNKKTKNTNKNKYYSIKNKWEFLLQEMKDIIRGNLDYKTRRLFLLRNLKYANQQLTKQANYIFRQSELNGYMNYTKSYNNQYHSLQKEIKSLHSPVKNEEILFSKKRIMDEETLIRYLKKNNNTDNDK